MDKVKSQPGLWMITLTVFQEWHKAKSKPILCNNNNKNHTQQLVWHTTYSTVYSGRFKLKSLLSFREETRDWKRSSSQIPQPLSATVTKIPRFQEARQKFQSKEVQDIRKELTCVGGKTSKRKRGRERENGVGWEGERGECCADASSKINANRIGIGITLWKNNTCQQPWVSCLNPLSPLPLLYPPPLLCTSTGPFWSGGGRVYELWHLPRVHTECHACNCRKFHQCNHCTSAALT